VTDATVTLVDEDTGAALRTWPNSVDLPFFPAAVTDQADGPPFRDAGYQDRYDDCTHTGGALGKRLIAPPRVPL
jgi:hypothetical protein